MTQVIGYRHGTRTVIPEAIAGVSSPTPHELVLRRALGSGQESTTTTSWSSSSNGLLVSDTLYPSPTSTPNSGGRHGISQTVLEWIFAVVALGLLTILVIWRCLCMRYRHRNLRASILPSSRGRGLHPPPRPRPRSYAYSVQDPQPAHIRDSEDIVSGSTFDRQTRALVLSPSFLHTGLMPLVDGRGVQINTPNAPHPRVRGHRVRGLDVDEGGRRGGVGGGEDGDGDFGPAEELPAYEMGKGPPGYQVAIGNTVRPDVVEVGLPERIEDHFLQHSEESQNTDPSSPRPNYTAHSLGNPQNRELSCSPPPPATPTSQEHQPPQSS